MEITKELVVNTGLAFLAGFVATFGAFLAATPKNPGVSALIAVASASLYAGARAAIGFLALNAKSVPAIPTDV